MSRRYLFGPITCSFADQDLARQRSAGDCIAFGCEAGLDLILQADDTWQTISHRLPAGCADFIVLYLPYTRTPDWVWTAPVPIIGLAADWNLCWSWYRHCLRNCDLVLTDLPGVEVLAREGIRHVKPANLFGCERELVELGGVERGARDIDVLFVGNFHPAVQTERLGWLGRLSKLANHRRIVICSNVWGEEYRKLLARSRIVFNRSVRGECNKRVFEAVAAGAVLFQEAGNREVEASFQNRQHCVYYGAENLEKLLEYYLDHEEERREIAEAARGRVQTFESLWHEHMRVIDEQWPGVCKRARRRWDRNGVSKQCVPKPEFGNEEKIEFGSGKRGTQDEEKGMEWLLARTWQALGSGGSDAALIADMESALKEAESAALHNALGIMKARQAGAEGMSRSDAAKLVVEHFDKAATLNSQDPMAALNHAEAIVACRDVARSVSEAERAIAIVEESSEGSLAHERGSIARRGDSNADCASAFMGRDWGHFPPAFDEFRVAWEQAGWSHAGDVTAEDRAKRQLIRWRLHSLLADLTGDLHHYENAAEAKPDSPATQARLGCAMARAGRTAEAIGSLRAALEINPFDRQAARALFQTLEDAGFIRACQEFARERRFLSRSAPGLVPLEDWAARTPMVGDELVSIIILCCNQLQYTEQCIESVIQHSRRPYELVVVDNGSSDGSTAYLDSLKELHGPHRIEVIHNKENVGFARGCNQALARARGDYVVFLNNDTIVTPQWLNGLIGAVLTDWPRIGMAGPMSNYAPPPQQAQPGYQDIANLPAFAERWRKEHAGKALMFERLTGFCLLARRDVLNAIGDFDERFGSGFFEDDDLCVRVREAGFGLIVATDIYIHHFGSKTVSGLGIDATAQLDRNLEIFRAKWGAAKAAGYRKIEITKPKSQINKPEIQNPKSEKSTIDVSTIQRLEVNSRQRRAKISLSMIVRNEQDNLPACLQSVADLVDEIVVLDTGSTDQTREVAAKLGANLIPSSWPESFAGARNESLEHATGEWIFWLDADDRIDEPNRQKLAALFDSLGSETEFRSSAFPNRSLGTRESGSLGTSNTAYAMKCRCLAKNGEATLVDHVRLFRNRPDVRWKYRVHEQIIPAVKAAGGQVLPADVVIDHVGYLDRDFRGQKHERNLRLLLMDLADDPGEPFTLFNVGWAYLESGKTAESIPYLRRSLARSHPSDSIVRKLYALITEAHLRLGQKAEALSACRLGRKWYPDDVELLSKEALLRKQHGDVRGAEFCWLRLLRDQEGAHFASISEGARGFATRNRLAELYVEQGRLAEAEDQWKQALAERHEYLPALRGLGELYVRQERFEDVDKLTAPYLAGVCRSGASKPVISEGPGVGSALSPLTLPSPPEAGGEGSGVETSSALEAEHAGGEGSAGHDSLPGAGGKVSDSLPRARATGNAAGDTSRPPQGRRQVGDLPCSSAWLEAVILKARRHFVTKEFAEARETLEQATEQAPTEPYLWRLLSDALLQEGKDWNHAEMALRRVLELDPNCHEVRNNLAVLLHQQSLAAT